MGFSTPSVPTVVIVDNRLVLLVLRADVQFLLDLIRELLLAATMLVDARDTGSTSGR